MKLSELKAGERARSVLLDGEDIYAADMDVVRVRQRIGMVFQRPNPFPKSIFENIAYGIRINGMAARKIGRASCRERV